MGKNDPVQENKETVHETEDETGTDEEDIESIHKSVSGDDSYLESVGTVNDIEEEPGFDR